MADNRPSTGLGNLPYTQDRIFHAIESMRSVRENQDCLVELDRLDTIKKHEIFDDLASAIAYAGQAYEKLKGA
jgi:hypothetical protein